MTGADDAHGNVLLRPYIVCARQEMCLCSFDSLIRLVIDSM
jgi:hypothetical protein